MSVAEALTTQNDNYLVTLIYFSCHLLVSDIFPAI